MDRAEKKPSWVWLLLLTALLPVAGQAQNGMMAAGGAGAAAAVSADSVARKSDVDAPISYDARHFHEDIKNHVLYLVDRAVVKYKSMTIEAGKITIEMDRKTLTAEPLPDSLLSATEDDSTDGNPRQLPVLEDGGDRIVGEKMVYNFDTGKGLVVRGRTDFETGKYSGRQIKKVASNVFNVSDGVFTSCEIEENPHFHFWAKRMKIIVGERVIAKPIVMYFGKIPVMALPFAMFPTEKGRRSGLVVPRYGTSATEGRFLRELGYYWAINDYLDARATVDYYDRSGWLFKAGLNYAKRYGFNGRITGSLTRKNFVSGTAERRWDLVVNHNQTLSKTSSFRANGRFVSDNSYYQDFSTNQNQRLMRQITSQATYSKRWPGQKASLSVSASETKDLDDGSLTRQLPQVSFSFSQRPIFKRSQSRYASGLSGRSGQSTVQSGQTRWYEAIQFGFRSQLRSSYTRTPVQQFNPEDSLFTEVFTETRNATARHVFNLSMNNPGKLFGVLGVSQRLDVNEDWFDREFVYADSTIERSERKGFFTRRVFTYSATANTKIYGFFQPRMGPVQALRHVMTPSMSFNYRPDFSASEWGYYREVTDSLGNTLKRDRFTGTPAGKQAGLNFSLANQFQMKWRSGEQEKKIDLFTMNISTGYNFAADQFKMRNLSTTISARPGKKLTMTATISHSPYVYDSENKKMIDKFLISENGFFSARWLRLVNINVNANFSLQGGKGGATEQVPPQRSSLADGFERFETQPVAINYAVPWSASFSLRYSISKADPANVRKTAYISINNADLRLSENWRVGFRGQFDFIRRQVVSQYWNIYRDLHCWELSLNWNPVGSGKSFYFRLNIKAPQLRDIKLERRGGRSSIFGGGYNY